MRHRPARERRLRISLSRFGETQAQIAILDYGVGISGDHLGKVFDAFWTTKTLGMGMGLAVCKSIVESCGGRIWVESNFFFQAEDGIRDGTVTGVQTCALPILPYACTSAGAAGNPSAAMSHVRLPAFTSLSVWSMKSGSSSTSSRLFPFRMRSRTRSEERRVGKECKSWLET